MENENDYNLAKYKNFLRKFYDTINIKPILYIYNYNYIDIYIHISNRALSARPRRQRERLRVASRLQSDVKLLHDFACFKANGLNLVVH